MGKATTAKSRAISHAQTGSAVAPLAEHPYYLKLDAHCNPLPRSAPEHAAVFDARTGLIHAARVVKAKNHAEAVELAKAHAAVNGHDDWRLPERLESESILDLTKFRPAIDEEFFPGTPSDWFWTNTAYAPYPADCAWGVYLYNGSVYYYNRVSNGFVRAVRGPVARPGQ